MSRALDTSQWKSLQIAIVTLCQRFCSLLLLTLKSLSYPHILWYSFFPYEITYQNNPHSIYVEPHRSLSQILEPVVAQPLAQPCCRECCHFGVFTFKGPSNADRVCVCAQARRRLPDGVLVAGVGGPLQRKHPRVPLHPASRGLGVDQRRHCALGPSCRMVQQHRLERRSPQR